MNVRTVRNRSHHHLPVMIELTMTKTSVICFTLIYMLTIHSTMAQSYQPSPENLKNREWFQDAKFGLFIHWGIYALPARHEWIKNREKISDEDYQKYFDHFDPDLYNPSTWAQAAKNAGMKYFLNGCFAG